MTRGMYPTKKELDKIKNWEPEEFQSMIRYVTERWNYDQSTTRIVKDFSNRPVLEWTLITYGWSGNESLINAILENKHFKFFWNFSWERGGKYVFRIDPVNIGYWLVRDYMARYGCSRQNIYQQKHKFKFIRLSSNRVFVKLIA